MTSSNVCVCLSFSPQVQPRALRSPATPSPPPSPPARPRGATSAPSATRTWWTRSFTPVDTCVSATPAALSSRKWPTRAAPSAGGQSRTSSRSTGARRFCACDPVTFSRRGCQSHEFIQRKSLFMCPAQVQQDSRHENILFSPCIGGDLWRKPKASSHFLKGNKFLYLPLQDRKLNLIY